MSTTPAAAAAAPPAQKEKKKNAKSKAASSSSAQKAAPAGLVPRDLPSVLKSRFFVIPSFDIYGGLPFPVHYCYNLFYCLGKAGLFDLGPPMAGLEQNVLQRWRKHFIQEERMVELSCSIVTPYKVLKSSGHVDKFSDLLIYDRVANEPYRADHLLEDFVEKTLAERTDLTEEQKKELESIRIHAEAMSPEEIKAVIEKWKILSPAGNKLDDPVPFNMMFQTKIGPTGKDEAFVSASRVFSLASRTLL